jgi:hypothetical protein
MFSGFVGLTAIDVSLCGFTPSQSVLTFAVVCVGVVQIAVPAFVGGAVPKTAPVTGAGASLTLCTNSIGCSPSPSSPLAAATPTASAAPSAERANKIVSHWGRFIFPPWFHRPSSRVV